MVQMAVAARARPGIRGNKAGACSNGSDSRQLWKIEMVLG
jgi:hypothetical protein